MKKLITILFVLLSLNISAATYYVATTGSDARTPAQAQNISTPWATWFHGMQQLVAGDTLYLRGGTYNITVRLYLTDANSADGTSGDHIVVMGYPGDSRPVYDFSGISNTGATYFDSKSYWDLIGFDICHAHDHDGTYTNFEGVNFVGCSNMNIRRVNIYDIHGIGFKFTNCGAGMYVRDCDSHDNYDALNNGGKADGFQVNAEGSYCHVYFDKCRAWHNSDDGWDFLHESIAIVDSCWAWLNGYDTDGSGQGMKAGLLNIDPPSNQYLFTNNVCVYNSHGGMRDNCNGMLAHIDSRWYNNTIAFNGGQGFSSSIGTGDMNTNILRNNLFYSNNANTYFEDISIWTHDHNSFDASPAVTVTAADFILVDSTGISAARQSDGSFPDNACYNNFLRLASTSDLINAGTDVGITYVGTAPDLGAYEYSSFAEEPSAPYIATTTPYAITANSAKTGGYMISDGGGTISAKGVCWGTSANPDLTDTVISGGTGTDDFTVTISGLVVKTIYHCRAYATNEVGTTYGEDEQFTTSQSSIIKHAGKIVKR